MKPGTGSGRGRHRGHRSPETRRWEEVAATLEWIEVADRAKTERVRKERAVRHHRPPERPGWLDPAGYEALLELRKAL